MKKLSYIVCILLVINNACNVDNYYQVYLIPSAYHGPIVIIENDPNGDDVPKKGDSLIFDFRKSIVLRFKNKFLSGSIPLSHLQYYSVNDTGLRERIAPAFKNDKNLSRDQQYLYIEYSQRRTDSQCDLISTPQTVAKDLDVQLQFADSLLTINPK